MSFKILEQRLGIGMDVSHVDIGKGKATCRGKSKHKERMACLSHGNPRTSGVTIGSEHRHKER